MNASSELNDSDSLFRYMKLSTLMLLLQGKAYFPSVSTFAKIGFLEGYLYFDQTTIMGKLVDCFQQDDTLEPWLAYNRENWEEVSAFHAIYARELLKRRAAWCWYKSRIESAAMWSIYANYGVAVKTSVGRMRQALACCPKFEIREIVYLNREESHNEDRFSDLILRPHLLKAKEFEHEHEVRVITRCEHDTGGMIVDQIKADILIESIVISPLVPRDEANAIETLVLKLDPNMAQIPVTRSTLLGNRVVMEDSEAAMDAYFKKHGSPFVSEGDLPIRLKEL